VAKKQSIEEGREFNPKFDKNGLIPAIAQDAKTGKVLMMAYMNRESLDLTIQTGCAVYFSRTRRKLWKKGEESGHIQKVQQILVDCDQDCLLLKVTVDAGQCHTGYQSCFYRALKKGSRKTPLETEKKSHRTLESPIGKVISNGVKLKFIAKKAFNPAKVYKKGKSGSINSP